MEEEQLDDEFSIMYEESARTRSLNSDTFNTPIKNLKVRKPVTLDRKQSVGEAVLLMQQWQFGCLLVTEGARLVGILTERDILLKILGKNRAPEEVKVDEIMTADPESLRPEDSIAFAMNTMHVGGFRHVPVVDARGVPLAVISVKDIMSFIVENFPEEILNLPPRPLRAASRTDGG